MLYQSPTRQTIYVDQHSTFFSTRAWADCWSKVFTNDHILQVHVVGSGPSRTMHFIRTRLSYGLSDLSSGYSHDFCVSPGWRDPLDDSTVRGIINRIPWSLTRSFTWKVRFDHIALARSLTDVKLRHQLMAVHILNLEAGYERACSSFSQTIRNQIRKGVRRGVSVRETSDLTDIENYQRIYSSLAGQKGWQFVYPARLTFELLHCGNPACFVVAEFEGSVIGGALFVRDGNSVYYMHGVADRHFDHLYTARAVLARGIKWACDIGVDFFNFGNSGSSNSLALFKSLWGTRIEHNWLFTWENPIWAKATKVKRRMQSFLKSAHTSQTSISHGAPWSQRAKLGELQAVLDVNGTERRLLMMHGPGLVAARKALSIFHEQTDRRPVVLDFGCGTGRMLRFFGNNGCDILGVEVTIEMLAEAKRYGLPSSAWLSHFDGLSIPIKDKSIDIVWVCGVLKYTLLSPVAKSRHGNIEVNRTDQRSVNGADGNVFTPTYFKVAMEIYRVLKPGGIVAQCEMFVDERPEVFTQDFEKVGFLTERISIVRRYEGRLEKLCELREKSRLPSGFVLALAQTCANLRYWWDDPYKPDNDFRDYFFVWRKPTDMPDVK
jgi:SAM-dependent methyltransferase